MAHAHAADRTSYYLDQLCSVAACGAMGLISILMFAQGKLGIILVPQFFIPVLVGGVSLIVLVLIRGAAVWREAGQARHAQHDHAHHDHAHHDHAPGEACDHEAACDHDHAHEHSWTPAKYAVLLLPVILYLLNMPHEGFSASGLQRMLGDAKLEGGDAMLTPKGDKVETLGFRELSDATQSAEKQAYFSGRTGRLKGMFMRLGSDKEFTLFKVKMRCCAADAVPVQVRIISPVNLTQFAAKDWVEVTGQIQFRKVAGQDKTMAVLLMSGADDVKAIPAENSEFEEP